MALLLWQCCCCLAFFFLLLSSSNGQQAGGNTGSNASNGSAADGFRAKLYRAHRFLPPSERIRRAVLQAPGRAKLFPAPDSTTLYDNAQAQLLASVYVGAPPQEVIVLFDTASSLFWVQCSIGAKSLGIFDTASSMSLRVLGCRDLVCRDNICLGDHCEIKTAYRAGHATGVGIGEVVAFNSFSGGTMLSSRLQLGCMYETTSLGGDAHGVMGFDRGPKSVVSQLGYRKFAHCIVLGALDGSPLFFGKAAELKGPAARAAQSIPVISLWGSNSYIVNVTGIAVGDSELRIPSRDVLAQGAVFDSSTTVTMVPWSVFFQITSALRRITGLRQLKRIPGHLPVCYDRISFSKLPSLPSLTFTFRNGANMSFGAVNYMWPDGDITCLAMMPSHGITIVGSFFLQNFYVLYDNDKSIISYMPSNCYSV